MKLQCLHGRRGILEGLHGVITPYLFLNIVSTDFVSLALQGRVLGRVKKVRLHFTALLRNIYLILLSLRRHFLHNLLFRSLILSFSK